MSTPIFLMSVFLSLVILWAVRTYMQPPLRLVLSVLIIVILLVALLSVFGWLGPLSQPISPVR
jgi:uncharacterized membrane protein